jgi:hypothetical protein
MTPGQIFFIFTGQAGAAGQVSDFKIEPISVGLCFHGIFSLIIHSGALYQRWRGPVNTTGKNSVLTHEEKQ